MAAGLEAATDRAKWRCLVDDAFRRVQRSVFERIIARRDGVTQENAHRILRKADVRVVAWTKRSLQRSGEMENE